MELRKSRSVRLTLEPCEDRTTPALYAVTVLSPAAGDPGETAATHAGQLRVNPALPTHDGEQIIGAATPADAIRAALTGTVSVSVGGRSASYPFGRATAGYSAAEHKPYFVEVAGTKGRVWLEDLASFSGSDWDYDDRSWRVSVRRLSGNGDKGGGGGGAVSTLSSAIDSGPFTWTNPFKETASGTYEITSVDANTWLWKYTVTNNDLSVSAPDNLGVASVEVPAAVGAEVFDVRVESGVTDWHADSKYPFWYRDSYTGSYLEPLETAVFTFKTPPVPILSVTATAQVAARIPSIAEGPAKGPGKPPKADIDIVVGALEMDEVEEDNPGALVVKRAYGNKAPRKQVVVKSIPGFTEGEVWVTWDGNVKLYPTDGNETPPLALPYELGADGYYKIPINQLPVTMYAEGSIESDNAKDTKITAVPVKGGVMGTPDSVTFTVMWIDVELRFDGQTSPMTMNDKADRFADYTETYDLGPKVWTYYDDNDTPLIAYGYGFEAKGYVSPSNINLAEFGASVLLDRDVETKNYISTFEYDALQFKPEDQIPRGNDRSADEWQDRDPTDSNPQGLIFDLDAPLWQFLYHPPFEWPPNGLGPYRLRFNFKEFGVVALADHQSEIRASKLVNGWLRYSFIVEEDLQNPGFYDLVAINDVPGDNTAGLGTTPTTWNLQ